ncbi:MAG: iron-sulfur cluster assembly accessory protein [Cyanobacteria bacterium P01_D01_bin.36]
MIYLTHSACQELERLRQRQNQPEAVCRLALQPSSCAQWAYTLSFDGEPSEADDVYEFEGLRLAVERDRAIYVKGLKIDFAEDLTGGAFRFDNPLATESCRCGYAFAIR